MTENFLIYSARLEEIQIRIKDDSGIMSVEIIEENQQFQQILGKKATCKTQNFYNLLEFLLISIALLLVFTVT